MFGLLVSKISVCGQLVHLPWSQGDAKYHYSVAVLKKAIHPWWPGSKERQDDQGKIDIPKAYPQVQTWSNYR